MAKKKTKFGSLNIYVKTSLQTIIFYEQLGFFIVGSTFEKDEVITKLMLYEKNDFKISIIELGTYMFEECMSINLNLKTSMPCTVVGEVDVKIEPLSPPKIMFLPLLSGVECNKPK